MKRFILYAAIFILLSLLSCTIPGKGPQVISVSVSNSQRIIDIQSFSEIKITFSKPMNRYITESSISISGYYGKIHYLWEENDTSVRLILDDPLEKGSTYTLTIEKSCESTQGYDLGKDLSYTFFTYEIDDEFIITETLPSDGDMIDTPDDLAISIVFSLPVEYTTIYDKVTIAPELPYVYIFSSDRKTLTLDIVSSLEANEIYTVTISTELGAHLGTALNEEYIFSFNTVMSTAVFTIDEAFMIGTDVANTDIELDTGYLGITGGVEKAMYLLVCFNSEFFLWVVEDYIDIEPVIPYWLQKEGSALRFRFTEHMAPGETYRVIIESSITNIFGVSLDREYTFEWVVNGGKSRLLESLSIEIVDPLGLNDTVIHDNGNSIHNESILTYPVDANKWVDFRMEFSTGIDVYGSLDKFSMNFLYGNADAVSGSLADYEWDHNSRRLLISFSLPGLSNGGNAWYKFVITGGEDGIKDSEGNYMEEDIEIYVLWEIPE